MIAGDRKVIRNTVVLLLILVLTGCGGDSGIRKQIENLDDAINDYAYALRWLRKNDAVAYHMNLDGSRPEIDTSAMDVIRVTGFTIKKKELSPDNTGATVSGELNYYHNEYGMLRTITYSQTWWFEPVSKRWYLDSEFPQFK